MNTDVPPYSPSTPISIRAAIKSNINLRRTKRRSNREKHQTVVSLRVAIFDGKERTSAWKKKENENRVKYTAAISYKGNKQPVFREG